jgi:hypothetical protein
MFDEGRQAAINYSSCRMIQMFAVYVPTNVWYLFFGCILPRKEKSKQKKTQPQ